MKDIKDIRFLIPSIFVLMLVGIAIGITAWSADTDSVSAVVQVQQYSVSVVDGDVDYGLLALSATKDTITLGEGQYVENNGNQAEKINIMGSNSSPDAWQLSATGAQGSDIYFHKFATDGGTAWSSLATSGYSILYSSLGISATDDLDLMIGVPSTTAATATQDVNVTVQATQL